MRKIDLSLLNVPQLKTIRAILADGSIATAETRKAKEFKKLQAENERLKKLDKRREAVESAGLDWDSDYWMSLDDKSFDFVLEKMRQVKIEFAIASATNSIKIPPIISQHELSSLDTARQGFVERKNGNGRRGLQVG